VTERAAAPRPPLSAPPRTEVFTTALLGMAVDAGEMNLDDPIVRYLPPGVALRPGALRSTARDMARFAAASLGEASLDGVPIPARVRAGIALAQRPVFRMPDDVLFQALAWMVRPFRAEEDDPLRIVFKDGGTAGFSAWVGVNPGKRFGVVLLMNTSRQHPGRAGSEMIGHAAAR